MLQSILRHGRHVAVQGLIPILPRKRGVSGRCCAAFAANRTLQIRTDRYHRRRFAGDPMATVLIADDDAAVRRLLSAVLRPRGHIIIEAGNGEQALELAGSENPALIVSDLMMPAMDGYELVRRLRIEPRTAQTPV